MSLHPDIKIGSILRDNSSCEGRTVTVDALFPDGIRGVGSTNGRHTAIMAPAIHCDGKKRKTGFTLVREGDAS
jgi:hypothetical protein